MHKELCAKRSALRAESLRRQHAPKPELAECSSCGELAPLVDGVTDCPCEQARDPFEVCGGCEGGCSECAPRQYPARSDRERFGSDA
jgi:hypothetical protein